MKTVFSSNSDCIHAFAQQSQNYGRSSGGGVFFDGKTLYSYGRHFELAKFINDEIVLINDTRYSKSTSKHQSIAFFALRQYNIVKSSEYELRYVIPTLDTLKDKLAKAKKPLKYIGEALALIAENKIASKLIPDNNDNLERREKFNQLKQFFLDCENSDNYAKYREAEKVRQQKECEKRAEYANQFKQAFKAFEPYEALKNQARPDYDLVRINGEVLETSQNVKVPLRDAKLLWEAYKSGKDIKAQRIDGYIIRNVSDSAIQIGCHNIKVTELNEVLE